MEIRGMKAGESDQVIDLLNRAFPKTQASFFEKQAYFDPLLENEHTRLLLLGGKILSCVRVYFRKLWCGEKQVLMGGIGDVGTDPAWQEKGLNSILMRDTVKYLEKEKAHFSFLFTTINRYYRQFGYRDLPTCWVGFSAKQDLPSVRYRKASLPEDLPFLMSVYDDSMTTLSVPAVRDRDYWLKQQHLPRLDPDLFVIAEKENAPAAYARGRMDGSILRILEYGFRETHGDLVRSLMVSMARRVGAETVELRYLTDASLSFFRPLHSVIQQTRRLMVNTFPLHDPGSCKLLPFRTLYWESDRF